ncbi:Ig-like domain-containing protein [Methanobrevibacter sp.]|uniref:Ig-like domain-containing protein n=1 Tax=Methanobrevibacter sp. TaxID=66852 RepID=UPI00386F37A3
MKLNKPAILSMFIFAILLLGAVSAEDNATLTDGEIAQDINVTFPEKVYKEDPVDIDVNLPDNAEGNLKATVDDVEIYNENITNRSVKIPVTIPASKLPYIAVNRMSDYTPHKIGLFYNDIALNLTHDLKLMNYKQDHDYGCGIPQEILQDDNSHYQSTSLIFPYSAKGTVEVYIDGSFSERLNTTTFTFLDLSKFNSLSLGNHTVRIVYSGDDYYLASDRTYNFTVVDMLIQIPKNIILEHDDCLTAKTLKNTGGTLKVYVDSKLVISKKLDKNGEFLESLFKYVKCGQQEIEVRYTAGEFSRSKKVLVNVSYYVDCWGTGFTYGMEEDVIIIVPTDFNKKLITITIDGVKYDKFTIDDSGWIELDTSKLSAGNHTLHFNFKGDEKYNSYTLTHNFTILYRIICPDWYADDYSKVTLILPSTAKGSLEVYIDGKLFKSQKLVSGKASIDLEGLKSGDHDISARYTGTDFKVDEVSTSIEVPAKPTIKASNKKVYYTDNSKYTVKIILEGKADDDAYVLIKVGGKTFERYTNSKGIVTIKLPKLKPGKYKITIWCKDVKVTKTLTVKNILTLKTVKIKKSAKKLVLKATLKKGKKAIKGKYVTFKFKGKTYKVKTNKKGVAKLTIKKSVLKKLKVGKKYTYKVSYLKASVKKTAKVRR